MSNENEPTIEHPPKIKWTTIAVFFSIFVSIVTILVASYLYFQFSATTFYLNKDITRLETKLSNTQSNLNNLQQLISDLALKTQTAQEQANKQEKILADWQAVQTGNLDKWYLAEAAHLVRLANDQAQLFSAQTVIIALLQRAEETLKNVADPRVAPIQKSLALDINNIQNTPAINVDTLYLQLINVDKQVNQLPLPIMQDKSEPQNASGEEKEILPWWQKGWEHFLQALKQIVIVHDNSKNALPLVIPSEKIFLYQNLHAQMENAMWGLLHRDVLIYQLSLQRAMDWIQQYFVQDAEITKNVLQSLQTLQKTNIQPPIINLAPTLQLFDQYFKGNQISS